MHTAIQEQQKHPVPNLKRPFRSFWTVDHELIVNQRVWRKAEQKKGIFLLDLLLEIEIEDGDDAVRIFWAFNEMQRGIVPDLDGLQEALIQ